MRFYIKEISGNETESYADKDKRWMYRIKYDEALDHGNLQRQLSS